MLMRDHLMIFTGNANYTFASNVAESLNINLGKAHVSKFSDGEIAIEILENVRGADVFILQPTCYPTNDNLIEVLVLADALKRASAGRITAALPYFGYARQDRRANSNRVPISAKLVANMLTVAGIDRVLTVDLHAEQIQGFFDIPVDNIYASPVLLKVIKAQKCKSNDNPIIISPDTGGVARARAFAKYLQIDMAIIDKRRPIANDVEIMNIIGEVAGKDCIIVDDMIDTANTLCKAAAALKKNGANSVCAYATHAVFSDDAINKINNSILDEVIVTDTIPLNQQSHKIIQVSIAPLFAAAIKCINNEESISPLMA